jgi:hypothetical protein
MSEDRTQQLPDDGVRLILNQLELLNSRMTALEEKVDRRSQETRPVWEQVLKRLDGMETRLEAIEYEFAALNLKLRVFNEDMLKMQHRQDATDERVRRLASEPKP